MILLIFLFKAAVVSHCGNGINCKIFKLSSSLILFSRWLIAQGRIDEAITVLKKFEYINKRKIPDEIMKEFRVRQGK